ncbi:peptidase S24, partial [Acinetobacter baumannii]|nr:peptidase S24 [Acinetobacter baumannii]
MKEKYLLEKNVKYILFSQRLTVTGLSKLSGVPQPTLFRWESGQFQAPTIKTV